MKNNYINPTDSPCNKSGSKSLLAVMDEITQNNYIGMNLVIDVCLNTIVVVSLD